MIANPCRDAVAVIEVEHQFSIGGRALEGFGHRIAPVLERCLRGGAA